MIGCSFHNLFRDLEPDIRVFRNSGFIVGNGNHRSAVFRYQRQDAFKPFILSGNRINKRPTLINIQARLECCNDRRINRQWNISNGLNKFNASSQDRRFVSKRNTCVDVKHMSARLNLCESIFLYPAVVSRKQLRRQDFSTCRIYSFTDKHKRLVESDDNFPRRRTDHCISHVLVPPINDVLL